MRYKPLGRTGLFVSELCLGTMTFGGSGDGIQSKIGQLQQEESERIVGRSLDAGINFIDTADIYSELHQPQVTSVIIGAKKAEQLADNIGATKVALGADELKRLDAVSRLPSEYPGWMFTRQGEVRRKQLGEAGRPPAI